MHSSPSSSKLRKFPNLDWTSKRLGILNKSMQITSCKNKPAYKCSSICNLYKHDCPENADTYWLEVVMNSCDVNDMTQNKYNAT